MVTAKEFTRAHSADTRFSDEHCHGQRLLIASRCWLLVGLCDVASARRRRIERRHRRTPASRPSRCSTSRTIRRASSTPSSTRRSPSTGWKRTGQDVDDRAVARRRRQAGPRGDRRPEGRRGDAGPGLRHRPDRRAGRSCCPPNWQTRLPNNSCPYTSTIVFLVRKGNPKGIKDWDDLVKAGVEVITPNPKTSGGGRLQLPGRLGLRAAKEQQRRSEGPRVRHRAVSRTCRCSTPAPAARRPRSCSARSATCCLAWENEALLAIKELGPDKVEIVVPSVSILAEPPVTVVDKNAAAHGTTEVAKAYLEYLYSPAGQKIVGQALLPAERAGVSSTRQC